MHVLQVSGKRSLSFTFHICWLLPSFCSGSDLKVYPQLSMLSLDYHTGSHKKATAQNTTWIQIPPALTDKKCIQYRPLLGSHLTLPPLLRTFFAGSVYYVIWQNFFGGCAAALLVFFLLFGFLLWQERQPRHHFFVTNATENLFPLWDMRRKMLVSEKGLCVCGCLQNDICMAIFAQPWTCCSWSNGWLRVGYNSSSLSR